MPQTMLANAIARKPIVMALDTPVTDQPVSRAIGCRNTGSENMRADRDAAEQAAGRDDHPAIARIVPFLISTVASLWVEDERDGPEPTVRGRRSSLFLAGTRSARNSGRTPTSPHRRPCEASSRSSSGRPASSLLLGHAGYLLDA